MRLKLKTQLNTIACLLAVTVLGGLAPTAFAGNIHVLGDVTFTPDHNALTLTADGRLAGLGNGDVLITIIAKADPTTTCTSPGGNEAPGQNPAPITITGTESIPASEVKNGSLDFSVTTDAPAQPANAKTAGCPNRRWTAIIEDLAFTSAIIKVEQDGKTKTFSFTFDPAL
jgi:hypothetical protein